MDREKKDKAAKGKEKKAKQDRKPKHYEALRKKHPEFVEAVEALGRAVQAAGPLGGKSVLLVQLGAAAAMRSEGSLRSHVRRAVAAGASPDEVRHALICLTSTIGFPAVAAALSWAGKELKG